MTRMVQCDRCGKQAREPYRCVPVDEREEARTAYYQFVELSISANEDADNGDFCSWQCLAEWAMAKAMGCLSPESAGGTPKTATE